MPLRIEPPWYPIKFESTEIRTGGLYLAKDKPTKLYIRSSERRKTLPKLVQGGYLYYKNANTGEIRKTYISVGEVNEVLKDLEKYRKLTSGLGYPWVPVRYEEPYIYYKSSVSGLETKSFVPPEMRADVVRFLKPSLGEPGKARIIDLHPIGKGKYAYIERRKFTELRETLSAAERATMPYNLWGKFTKRTGVVEKVLDAETILVDGVIVKIKYAQAPDLKLNPAQWLQGKQYLESITLNQNVLLKIDLNAPTDAQGTTVAEVYVMGAPKYIPRNQTINLSIPPSASKYFRDPAMRGVSAAYPGGDIPLINLNETTGKIEFYNLSAQKFKEWDLGGKLEGKKEGYELSVYNLLAISGFSKTYEQMTFEREEKIRKDKAERSAFVQSLMGKQTDITKAYNEGSSPIAPDRPGEFGGLDWLLIDEYMLWASLENFANYLDTSGKTPEDNKLMLWLNKQSAYYDPSRPQYKLFGGTWGTKGYADMRTPGKIQKERDLKDDIRLNRQPVQEELSRRERLYFIMDVVGAPSTYVGYGAGLQTRRFVVGTKTYPLSTEGEQLYIYLRKTRGEFKAKWLWIQSAKKNSDMYIQKEGLRILGTNIEFLSQPTVRAITSAAWEGVSQYPLLQPAILPLRYTLGQLPQLSLLAKIIKSRLFASKSIIQPVDDIVLNQIITDLKTEIRTQKQATKADVHILKIEAKALGGYDERLITELIEDKSKLSQYPQLAPIIERIEARNREIASLEMAWGLLDKTRTNYMLHAMTPAAKVAAEKGVLKLPPASLSPSGKENIVQILGNDINPYNYHRIYGESIREINEWSVKNNGYPLFVEKFSDIMVIREEMHATSIAVMEAISDAKLKYGRPLSPKLPGYGVSKIPQFADVQLPENVIRLLEGNEIIRSRIPALTQPHPLVTALKYSDTAQRIWRVGVTFGDPSWLPSNVQSGIYVAAFYARIYRVSSWINTWKELARRSETLSKVFKLSKEGGVITDVYNEKILASDLMQEMVEEGILGVEGGADITRHYKFGLSDNIFDKFWKTASWALKNSEDIIRAPMYYDLRVEKGLSRAEAKSIVMHTQGNYAKSALSPFEFNVMTRLTNFYVWYKFAPTLVVKQLISEPRTLTIPFHLMNAWNGDRGDVERQYITDRQLTRMIFRIPLTDAYTTPAIFSLANSAYKLMYVMKSRERGFYWDELKRDPDLLLRFLKDEIDVNWLNRGAGRVTIEGNKATITYVETGDSISANLNSTKNTLTIVDDMTGAVLKEFPFENNEGKFGIYKERTAIDTVERVMAEYGARTLMMPIELVMGKDFKFNSPITSPFWWTVDQFIGTIQRSMKEATNPTVDWREKLADLTIGWFIDHLRDNPMIPRQDLTEKAVSKVIGIKIWEVERGDYYGCGA